MSLSFFIFTCMHITIHTYSCEERETPPQRSDPHNEWWKNTIWLHPTTQELSHTIHEFEQKFEFNCFRFRQSLPWGLLRSSAEDHRHRHLCGQTDQRSRILLDTEPVPDEPPRLEFKLIPFTSVGGYHALSRY